MTTPSSSDTRYRSTQQLVLLAATRRHRPLTASLPQQQQKLSFAFGGILTTAGESDMRRFVLEWKRRGLEDRLGSRIVTYADDLVILCRGGRAAEALQQLRAIMARLRLTVNEEKTRICKVPEASSSSWVTRSDGCTNGRPATPIWVSGHRRRASGAWWRRSMR